MRKTLPVMYLGTTLVLVAMLAVPAARASGRQPRSYEHDRILSGDFATAGNGTIAGPVCSSSTASQPSVFAGNFLLNCDDVGPHPEVTIAVNPTNPANVIAGSLIFNTDQPGGKRLSYSDAYVTKDGGSTWTTVRRPMGSYQGYFDPNVTFGADGRAYYASVSFHASASMFSYPDITAATSDDGGSTWSDPVRVAQGTGALTFPSGGFHQSQGEFNDFPSIVADTNPTSPFRGNVYVTWERYDLPLFSSDTIFFSRSSDGGRTWSDPQEISGSSPTLCGPSPWDPAAPDRCAGSYWARPVVAPDGTIWVSFGNIQRTDTGRTQILLVRSTDGGRTWSAPVTATNTLLNDDFGSFDAPLAGCDLWVRSLGSFAVSASGANRGQLAYAYVQDVTPAAPTSHTLIQVVASSDGGTTWSAPVTVAASQADQAFPSVAYGLDGRLRVGFVDRNRSGPPGQPCVYGYSLGTAKTTAAGTKFSAPVRLETAVSVASESAGKAVGRPVSSATTWTWRSDAAARSGRRGQTCDSSSRRRTAPGTTRTSWRRAADPSGSAPRRKRCSLLLTRGDRRVGRPGPNVRLAWRTPRTRHCSSSGPMLG